MEQQLVAGDVLGAELDEDARDTGQQRSCFGWPLLLGEPRQELLIGLGEHGVIHMRAGQLPGASENLGAGRLTPFNSSAGRAVRWR